MSSTAFLTQNAVDGDAFDVVSVNQKDELVRKNTKFTSWQQMLSVAGAAQLQKELS